MRTRDVVKNVKKVLTDRYEKRGFKATGETNNKVKNPVNIFTDTGTLVAKNVQLDVLFPELRNKG